MIQNKSLKSNFLRYASLNVVGMLGLSCYILADTFFIARGVGPGGLAALNLALPVYSFLNGVGLLLGMGGATRFALSQDKGVFTQSLYGALFAALLFSSLGIFFPTELATLLGAEGETLLLCASYLQVILCFAPLFLLNNVMLCFIRNDKAPQLAMAAMLIGSFSNIILDYVFVFPCGMGMFGAALATAIAPLISLLILSTHILRRRTGFRLFRSAPRVRALGDIAALGSAPLLTEFSSGVVMLVFNFLVLNLAGQTGLAAYGILANIGLVVLSLFTGIAQGMQPLLSAQSAAEAAPRRQLLRWGLVSAVSIALFVYVFCFAFADGIVSLFNKDQDPLLASLAVDGLRLHFSSFLFAGVNLICIGYFAAIDRPKASFSLSFLRGFALILPLAFLLSSLFDLTGIFLTTPLSELLVLFGSLAFLLYRPRVQKHAL